jgi:sarcosine/dimethylglycine N-methyltransferase
MSRCPDPRAARPERTDMNDTPIRAQYSTGLSRRNIERALVSAGKDLDHLQPLDLALLEDFHTMGRIATSQLVDLIGITSDSTVLDAGSGIGGTARYVADVFGCNVTAVDLTDEYCDVDTSMWGCCTVKMTETSRRILCIAYD